MTRLLKQFILTAMLALFASQASALFVQPDTFDPRMQGVGTNRYAYAGSDPVNNSDPNGHSFWDWFKSQSESDDANRQDADRWSRTAQRYRDQAAVGELSPGLANWAIQDAEERASWYQMRIGVSKSLRMRLDLGLSVRGVAFVAVGSVGLRGAAATEGTVVGSVRNINPTGALSNCGNCVIATDRMLAGSPTSALPQAGRGVSLGVLERELGGRFVSVNGRADIERIMINAGSGSRGVVAGVRQDVGHVFNVVNQNGTIRFLDGQIGGPATFESNYIGYFFMRTN